MKKLISASIAVALLGSCIGCGETNEVKREINIKTPGGTTIKTELKSKETKTEKDPDAP